jgi:biopolymer transport protein ExbB
MKRDFWSSFKTVFSMSVIPVALVAGCLIYWYIFGDPSHFVGNNHDNMPLPGDLMGTVFKGGMIVPIILCLLLTVIIYSIERYITIGRASGKGSVVAFVYKVKNLLDSGKISDAQGECDKQKGSVANVIKSGLEKYQMVEKESDLSKDQKVAAIQKEIEEATSLELPSLQQNLVVISTIASVATLMGLLGTVLGMIRAFAAMSNAGAPDSVALATGISEALVNTAFGIGTGALAIIMYNFYTTKIDKLTYSIDEAGFSIVSSYVANHK